MIPFTLGMASPPPAPLKTGLFCQREPSQRRLQRIHADRTVDGQTVPLQRLGTGETFARWALSQATMDRARAHYPFLWEMHGDYGRLA